MVGVALHRCGAAHVTCTDGDAQTVANCRRNLRLNGVPLAGDDTGGGGCSSSDGGRSQQQQQAAECRQLRWEDGWPSGGGRPAPTLVLGADLLYDPGAIPTLLALLKQALAAGGTARSAGATGAAQLAAYLATTLRNEATLQQFLAAAEADPGIRIQQLAGPGAAAGDGGGGDAAASGAAAVEGGGVEEQPPRFLHLAELEAARSRIFLHRITLAT